MIGQLANLSISSLPSTLPFSLPSLYTYLPSRYHPPFSLLRGLSSSRKSYISHPIHQYLPYPTLPYLNQFNIVCRSHNKKKTPPASLPSLSVCTCIRYHIVRSPAAHPRKQASKHEFYAASAATGCGVAASCTRGGCCTVRCRGSM